MLKVNFINTSKVLVMFKLNARGTIAVSSPYSGFVSPTAIYELVEIRDIRVLQEAGVDVLTTVYESVGLTETEYTEALKNNDPIFNFLNDAGEYIYIPKSYVTSTIDVTVYEYNERTIGVNVGLLPKGYDLTTMKSEIVTLIESHIGIVSKIKDIVSSNTIGLNNADNDSALVRIKQANGTSCPEKLRIADDAVASLNCKIDALQCKIDTVT